MPQSVTLTSIDLENQELQHIPLVEGEEKAECVLLNNNQIYNIENLVSLPVISFLNLSNNLIHKVQNLEGMGSLKELRLDNNFIESLSDLSSLTRLEKLSVRNNKLRSVQGLHRLQWLSHLDISSNLIEHFDVQGLCPSLEVLDVSLNKLQSLISIQKYTLKLKELNVQQNPLEKNEYGKLILSRFPELQSLKIDGYLERIIEGLEEDCAINGKFIVKGQSSPGMPSEVQKSIEGKLGQQRPENREEIMPITPVHSLKPIEVTTTRDKENQEMPTDTDERRPSEFTKQKSEEPQSKWPGRPEWRRVDSQRRSCWCRTRRKSKRPFSRK